MLDIQMASLAKEDIEIGNHSLGDDAADHQKIG